MEIIDSHAHCQKIKKKYRPRFFEDLYGEAGENISKVINVAISYEEIIDAIDPGDKNKTLFKDRLRDSNGKIYDKLYNFAYGLHPKQVYQSVCSGKKDMSEADIYEKEKKIMKKIKEVCSDPSNRCVAIGETGYDFHDISYEYRDMQRRWYEFHIRLAHELNLPLIIHHRSCSDLSFGRENANIEGIKLLRKNRHLLRENPGIIHSFNGNMNEAKILHEELGFLLGVSGLCLQDTNSELRDVIKAMPLEWMVLESDSPYLLPQGIVTDYKQNTPLNITFIAEKLAELKETSIDEIALVTTANTLRVIDRLNDGNDRLHSDNALSLTNTIEEHEMTEEELMCDIYDEYDDSFVFDISTASPELKNHLTKLPKQIENYLVCGCYEDGAIYYNRGLDGINSFNKHFFDPVCMIKLCEVEDFLKDYKEDPEMLDLDKFEIVIDEQGESFRKIIIDGKIRYLIYTRYFSNEIIYYDIQEQALVKTGFFYDTSYYDRQYDPKGIIKLAESENEPVIVVYNLKEDRYGVLQGIEIEYDKDWLKEYTKLKRKLGRENVHKIISNYEKTENKNLDTTIKFVSDNIKKIEYMNDFLKSTWYEDNPSKRRIPNDIVEEIFDDIDTLSSYLSRIIKSEQKKWPE